MTSIARQTLLGLALFATACGSPAPSSSTGETAEADEVAAPDVVAAISPPPSSVSARIGIYHWGPDFSAWPGYPDKLNWGVGLATAMGTSTVRVAISTRDDYGVNNGASTLTAIAEQPAYETLFSNPSISTFLLTTYTTNDLASNWSDGYTSAEVSAERAEIRAFATHLLKTYSGKTFIVLNWEGDNALSPYVKSNTAWAGYVKWINARVNGVLDGRKAVPTSTSQAFSGLEYNAVVRTDTGKPCDAARNKCVISYVAPKVAVDYYSYSSWQSLGTDTTTSGIPTRLTSDLDTAYGFVSSRSGLGHANFIVGEFGAARDISGECDAAARESQVVTTVESWGASFGIAWQMLDNTGASGIYDGFGRYRRDLSISLAGETFQNLYSTGTPTVPAASCGAISPGGVVNGVTFGTTIEPGNTLSIFGAGFSSSGNTVWIKEVASFIPITSGSPYWYESTGQINATLPSSVGVGDNLNVFVTGASGLGSNGQLINVVP